MPIPLVSIIIVTWNGKALLQKCLPSVVESGYDSVQIIVADNASTDGSADWVEQTYPSARVLRFDRNHGFSVGNNLAVAQAEGRYIVFLNNDVEVTEGWLDPLVEFMETNPDVGAVQPKILQYGDRAVFEYAGACGGFLDALGYPFARGRIFDTIESDRGQYDETTEVFWASGAALCMRKTALDAVGLFDERFEMHMEEIDLCWRLRRAGYSVAAVPRSVVYHIGGASLLRTDPRKTYLNFRNNLVAIYKNVAPNRWRRIFLRRLAMDAGAIVYVLLTSGPRSAWAIVRAYRDGHRMTRHYSNVRSSADGTFPPYHGSVVFDYFLRRRRHFSALPPARFGDEYQRRHSATTTAESTISIPAVDKGPGSSAKST